MKKTNSSRRTLKMLAALALVSLTCAAVALAAPSKTKTFSAGHFVKGVPNDAVTVKKLKVTKKGKITDLNAVVGLSTFENDDFDFYLLGPSGKAVQLSTGNGGSGSGYGGSGSLDCDDPADIVTFDDEAATNIDDTEGIDTALGGSYRPEGQDDATKQWGLNTFDGKQLKGNWRLLVGDNQEIGFGNLQCFKLTATYTPQTKR